MWIVLLALRRPYTFVVVAMLIAILGVAAIISMPVDIFPYIDIPVVSVVWQYGGLSPEEMEKRIMVSFERSITTTVNDIEHIESQAYNGVAVKVDLMVPRRNPPLLIPGDALVVRADGPQVAAVGEGGLVHFERIKLGRDYGDAIEVESGLNVRVKPIPQGGAAGKRRN